MEIEKSDSETTERQRERKGALIGSLQVDTRAGLQESCTFGKISSTPLKVKQKKFVPDVNDKKFRSLKLLVVDGVPTEKGNFPVWFNDGSVPRIPTSNCFLLIILWNS